MSKNKTGRTGWTSDTEKTFLISTKQDRIAIKHTATAITKTIIPIEHSRYRDKTFSKIVPGRDMNSVAFTLSFNSGNAWDAFTIRKMAATQKVIMKKKSLLVKIFEDLKKFSIWKAFPIYTEDSGRKKSIAPISTAI